MRAVIYTRVSTDEQVKNLSLETQRRECERYCQSNGLTVDKVFTDKGESAKTTNRPEFQSMLRYCAKSTGKIKAVVVYHTSRFARDSRDHLNVAFELNGCGVKLHSVSERLEDTPAGRFIQTMMAGANQLDNEQRAERCKTGMRAALEKGRWPFPAPLGYKNARNAANEPTLVHDPTRAPQVAEAFRMYGTGLHSKKEVLAKVTALGLMTATGGKVTLNVFAKMLDHPIYAGMLVVKRWELSVRGNFPGIITQDQFDRVQAVCRGRKYNRPPTHQQDRADLPLRGTIRCSCCDSHMTGYFATGRHGGKYGYYGCYNPQCASRVSVRKEKAEAAFEQHLRDRQPTPQTMQYLTRVMTRQWNARQEVVSMGATQHQATITEIERKLARLEEAFVFEQAIDKERYAMHRAQLENQLAAARLAMYDAKADDLDLDKALQLAGAVLTNTVQMYEKMQPDNRRKFLRVLSPDGWSVDRAGTVRTPETAHVYRLVEAFSTPQVSFGTPGGI